MNISRISVKRPIAVIMVVMIFVVIGVYSLSMFSIELMPEMELSMALVYTSYPNVGSEEVENLVTKTVEGAVSSVSGAKSVTSQSSEGASMVMIEFSASTDMDKAVQDLSDSIDLIEGYLPEDAEEPMVLKLDTSMMPVAMMSVSYEGMNPIQTKKYVEDNVQNKLEAVDGVASVTVSGAQDRIIEVEVDPQKLFGYGVDMTDIATAISAQNINLPAGTIENKGKELTLRAVGKFSSVEEINTIPLMTDAGQIVYLRDVASVSDTYSEQSTIARLNGEDSLSISISAESDANTVDVVNAIITTLDSIKAQNSKFSYNMTMEQASYIEESINSVAESAVMGAVLAILILLLFLANFKTSMVIGISMPISVVTTFIGMYFSGMTLNVVSLGGLALGVGMLVDNSVVVLENIFRRKDELGEDSETSAIKGSSEVIGAVVASVLTTCIVYVPILFIDNMMAVMFKQLAFTIIFSQCASLLTTFLLVPMLASKIKKNEPNKKLGFILNPFARFMDRMYVVYEKALRWVLSHRKVFMLSIMGLFVLSMVVLGMIGMTLMPESDEGSLTVNIELPEGVEFEKTNALTLEIEEIISTNENVETVFANVGSGSMSMLGQSSDNASSVTITLKEDRKVTTEEAAQEIRDSLSDIAGAVITVNASSSMGMSSNEIQFDFTGSDDKVLEEYVLRAEKVLAGIDGIVETETSIADKKSEMQIKIDSARAARYGMSTATVASAVNSVLSGSTAGRYTEGGMEYDIEIVYPEDYVSNVDALRNMQIKTYTGQWISLSDVADVKETQGYTTLTRVDQKRVISLTGKIFGTDMGTVNKEFDKALQAISVPDGISRNTSGSYETMMEAMTSLLLAIVLGILLMYMVMAAQFENISQPFIILFTLPLAMIGVVLSLVISGSSLSVVGCIGILMLTGIVVNNAIVLIDFVNTAKVERPDISRTELLIYAGKTRMRPVLMTSLTSILGFLPMAVASGSSGAAMMQPLAVVLVGGLTVGTFLTLLVIPVVYSIFDDGSIKRKNKKVAKLNKA
ncbi:MAG: efflux RND transporter permease subunit [Clostridia bacterium]|nr:efflux RND transporter permease subunit [Clostridia bacterium]